MPMSHVHFANPFPSAVPTRKSELDAILLNIKKGARSYPQMSRGPCHLLSFRVTLLFGAGEPLGPRSACTPRLARPHDSRASARSTPTPSTRRNASLPGSTQCLPASCMFNNGILPQGPAPAAGQGFHISSPRWKTDITLIRDGAMISPLPGVTVRAAPSPGMEHGAALAAQRCRSGR